VRRSLLRLIDRLQLNPSNWIPRLPVPKGIYQQVHRWNGSEADPQWSEVTEHGERLVAPYFSTYELVWHYLHLRREARKGEDAKDGWVARLAGSLHELSTGIYDTSNWIEVADGRE
jgi:hypothetical protein